MSEGMLTAGASPVRGTTWNDADPPVLPAASLRERVRGTARLAVFVTLTLVALALFVAGRWLRHWLGRWVTFHFAAARLWSLAGLRLAGLSLEVEGEPVDGGALVANHSSWLDILALRAAGTMYFVSKSEVADWPGVGFVTRVTGTIFIERKRAQAKRQGEVLRSRMAADQRLLFFPEGTSTDGERVLAFKSSLFSAFFDEAGRGADVLVQPVSVRYRTDPRDGLPPAFYGWWGTMDFGRHVFDVLARSRRGRVRLVFHAPVRAADFADRKALAERCGRVVAGGHAAS